VDKRKKILAVASVTGVVAQGGGGLAYAGGATGGEADEKAVTGPDADRAGKAAVDSVGGGTVVNVFEDKEGEVAYSVEVKKADGSTTEVEITKNFTVAAAETGGDKEGAVSPKE
jgi:uncharacterized membrane protein YkoI